jgi:hypothetical protein
MTSRQKHARSLLAPLLTPHSAPDIEPLGPSQPDNEALSPLTTSSGSATDHSSDAFEMESLHIPSPTTHPSSEDIYEVGNASKLLFRRRVMFYRLMRKDVP